MDQVFLPTDADLLAVLHDLDLDDEAQAQRVTTELGHLYASALIDPEQPDGDHQPDANTLARYIVHLLHASALVNEVDDVIFRALQGMAWRAVNLFMLGTEERSVQRFVATIPDGLDHDHPDGLDHDHPGGSDEPMP